MSNRFMRSLENPFELSSCAAFSLGPNTSNPRARSASESPTANGASGPITTKSGETCSTSSCILCKSVGSTSKHGPTSSIPGLPGAQKTSSTSSDCAIFQAKACSRPPDPTTSIFMAPAHARSRDQDQALRNFLQIFGSKWANFEALAFSDTGHIKSENTQ